MRDRRLEDLQRALRHDMKSPLTVIATYANVLDRLLEAEHPGKAHVGPIQKATAQLSETLGLLARWLSITPGSASSVALADLIPLVTPEGLEVHMDVSHTVVTSPDQLGEAIGHVLDNVRVHAAGSAAHIHSRADGRTVVLTIEDTGPGLPPGATERWLAPVAQAGHGDRPGMGLTLAAALVAPGGTLRLEHARPGCRVVFELAAG